MPTSSSGPGDDHPGPQDLRAQPARHASSSRSATRCTTSGSLRSVTSRTSWRGRSALLAFGLWVFGEARPSPRGGAVSRCGDHRRRRRRSSYPPLPRAQPVAEGRRSCGGAACPLRGVLGAAGRLVRGPEGVDVRPHRRERLGQEHAAQVHGPDPAARVGCRSRTTGKISALLELGAGFHPELSGRENVYLNGAILGLSQAELDARFDEIVGVRRPRAVHRHAGEELLVGHVRAPRLLGRDQRRPRHPARSTRCSRSATRSSSASAREVRRAPRARARPS